MSRVSLIQDSLESIIMTPKRMPIADMQRESLISDILIDYLSRLDDNELSELEDIIVNQFGED
jgi:hypothetical protein